MIVNRKWVAAGSTATLLAGGLLLGAPAASAAPGDDACLQASTQFNAALGAAGVNAGFVNQFEAATAAAVAAAQNLAAVSASLNLDALAAEAGRTSLNAGLAQLAVENAEAAVQTALTAATEEDTDGDGNPENDQRVIDARAALAAASEQETLAVQAAVAASAALEAAAADPALVAAQAQLEAAAAQADALLAQLSGDAVLAQQLLDLFEAFLAACSANAIGVDPAALPAAPAAPGAGVTASAGSNRGLNVQTAAAEDSPAAALIAALLAVGVAVPVTMAVRMRRLERTQR